jgi:hypothetical protein
MKKTILFLMNGFGIEQVDSYSIYTKDLMPNLDNYTKEYLFSSIESKATTLEDGLLNFSTGVKLPLSYSLVDRIYNDYANSKNFNFYVQNIRPESKIHLFCFVESDRVLEHLKYFVNFINSKCQNPIFIHCVLTSNDINNYKEIERTITRIHYDFNNCKVATIIGENTLKEFNLTSYMNMLQNEIGEKWRELSKKFNSLQNSKIAPNDVKEFIMNEGFRVEANDNLFFFNYKFSDMENFISSIAKVVDCSKTFSLFPIKGIKYPMLAYPKSGISFMHSLKKISSKALVVSDSKRISKINYYLTGLQSIIPENISYVKSDNGYLDNINNLKAIMDDDFDLIVIDYSIDECSTIPQIKELLSKLDVTLKNVVDYSISKEYSLFISSLYGIKKEMPLDNFTKYLVDFASKVPFIVVDPVFKKDNFRIDIGDVNNLAHTVYTSIDKSYSGGNVLIKKKGFKFKK